MKKTIITRILAVAALFAGLLTASAALTPYAWYQMGEKDQILPYAAQLDSGPNNILFGPDNFFDNRVSVIASAQIITNVAAGGPLGPNNITSVESLRVHYVPGNGNGGMSHGGNTPAIAAPNGTYPATADLNGFLTPAGWSWQQNSNWVMEVWILPIGNGSRSGDPESWMLSCGGDNISSTTANGGSGRTNWGVQLRTVNTNSDGTKMTGDVYLIAETFGPTSGNIGPHGRPMNQDTNGLLWNYRMFPGVEIKIKTATNNSWTHVAVVRDSQATPAVTFYPGELGTVTLYTNGVAIWSTNASRVWQAAMLQAPFPTFFNQQGPTMFGKRGNSWRQPFNGFMDEVRFSSFTGAFSTSDMLLRSVPGPGIVKQPANVTVYAGNAAPFQVIAAFDTSLTYKWWKVVASTLTAIGGSVVDTNAQLIVPSANYSSGDTFVCAVANTGFNSGTVYTTTNTVTTVANPAAIGVYNAAVQAETSLISYFPGDTDSATGTALTDVKSGNNGTISGNAAFDASTNRFAGGQGLTFNRDGEWSFDVKDDVTIPALPNSDYDFTNGFGTVEAVLYLDPAAQKEPWALNWPWSGYGYSWLSVADLTLQAPNAGNGTGGIESLRLGPAGAEGLNCRYVLSMDTVGNIIYYAPFNTTSVSGAPNGGPGFNNAPIFWPVPGGTVGRRLHVAITFNNTTNVTCYVNGQSLGTLTQPGFGPTNGLAMHVGNANYSRVKQDDRLLDGTTESPASSQGWYPAAWYGSIDEVALYRTNLTANQIATHAYKLLNGSSASPATATIVTASKSMFAGGTQKFAVQAGGEPPWIYQWRTNGVAFTGATNSTFTYPNIRATVDVTCVIQGAFGSPATSAASHIAITTPVLGSYADQVMSNAPVAFYRFNETNGSTAFDWAGSHDGSYNGPTSTYQKNATGPTVGEGGFRAFGTNAANSRTEVRVPYAPELNGLTSPTNAFSYEVWFNANSSKSAQTVFSGRFRRGNNKAGVTVLYNNDGEGISNEDTVNKNFLYRFGKYFNIQQTSQINPASTFVAVTNQWHHLVITFDGAVGPDGNGMRGNRVVYYDGTVWNTDVQTINKGDLLQGSGTTDFNLNRFAPLIIGNCPDNENTVNQNRPVDGTVADLAVYDRPLSSAEVTAHYSAFLTPAFVQVNPAASTASSENYTNTIKLTAQFGGAINTYQWFLVNGGGSNALSSAALNADGTQHYPVIFNGVFDTQGVDAQVLLITQPTPADAGTYVLVAYNNLNTPLGYAVTSFTNGVVTVTSDTTKPLVTSVVGLGQVIHGSTASPGTIQIRFSKRLNETSAVNIANYAVSGGVNVTNAYLSKTLKDARFGGNYLTVTLQTSALTPGASYTLTISGVFDQAGTPNTIVTVGKTFNAPIAKQGLVWDYYANVPSTDSGMSSGQYFNDSLDYNAGLNLTQGTNSFPFVPQYETTLATFDTVPLNSGGTPVAGTGLGGNLVFGTGAIGSGPGGTNYGVIISGWITPTNTDNYTFFLRNDDSASLYLSPNNSPDMMVMIAQGSGVQSSFLDVSPGVGIPTSAPQTLTAGVPYFIQVILRQTTGNDYASVAWRSATGPDSATPAASLKPIPGSFLSSYGQAQPVLTATKLSTNKVVLSWSSGSQLLQSTNVNLPVIQWTQVVGNPSSPYTNTTSGQLFYILRQ